ncbi:hypothetical protein RGQ29_023292 [Quercus rubra]|uniref:PPM-type phosphatase domain-containing protein n=1 Tax=Quercus rubra TaxID=3512 RepID=A0AAN7ITH8_QUERU|nr:hypothetical protein RGQ29_023292 [Quercus rubra]
MGLKDLHLKFKAFRLRRFLIGDGKRKKKGIEFTRRPSWMMPVSHGYYVVEDQSFRGGSDDFECSSVVVQREPVGDIECWFFGVSDNQIADGIHKYIQSHLFSKNPNVTQVRRNSKEIMRKAYLCARAKIRETYEADEIWRAGSVSALVMNAEKLVTAYMGDYRAVVCRNGVAHQISSCDQQSGKRHWSRRLMSVRILGFNFGKVKQPIGSELVIAAERIDSSTEFVIIASAGIWEVMQNQEAVNLIRHLEDPKEAAGCLAKEALNRMSKSSIACLIIHFD